MSILLSRAFLAVCLSGISMCANFTKFTRLEETVNKNCPGSSLWTQVMSSKIECGIVCHHDDNCNAIHYNTNTRHCTGQQYNVAESPECQEEQHNIYYGSAGGECLPGYSWNEAAKICYRISTTCETWEASRAVCQQEGTDLLVLKDPQFASFFINLLKSEFAGPCVAIWVGASDITSEGNWVWVDGDPVDGSFWAPSEPNAGSSANCLDMYPGLGYKGADFICSGVLNFACGIAM